MKPSTQEEEGRPEESELELVVSLDEDDVLAIERALMDELGAGWTPADEVVRRAFASLAVRYARVPPEFFSWCLRGLVASGEVRAEGPVARGSAFLVAAGHGNRPPAYDSTDA